MKRGRTIFLLVVAMMAGVAAAFLIWRGPPRDSGGDADEYCYQTRQASVCTYTRTECEARLAREAATDVTKRCTPQADDVLTP